MAQIQEEGARRNSTSLQRSFSAMRAMPGAAEMEQMAAATAAATKAQWEAVKVKMQNAAAFGRSAISETVARLSPDRHRTFRLISREHSHKTNIRQGGLRGMRVKIALFDLFHTVLNMRWPYMLLIMTSLFLFMHLIFGGLMFLGVWKNCDAVTSFCTDETDAFTVWLRSMFLSVQAGQSIGFGLWAPVTHYLNVLVCFDAYVFVVYYAVLGGIMYAKLTRPSRMARCIIWSKEACVNSCTYHYNADTDQYSLDPTPCLTLRMVSTRRHQMMTPTLRLYLLRLESEDGPDPPEVGPTGEPSKQAVWRIHDLDADAGACIRGRMRGTTLPAPHTLLPITVVHVMDKDSPLFKATPESLVRSHAEVIVVYEAVDEACSSSLQSRWSYLPNEIIWNAQFDPILNWENIGEGKYRVDLDSFDSWEKIDNELDTHSARQSMSSPRSSFNQGRADQIAHFAIAMLQHTRHEEDEESEDEGDSRFLV